MLVCYGLLQSLAWAANGYTQLSNASDYTLVNQVIIENPTDQTMNGVRISVPLPGQDGCTWQTFVHEVFDPQPERITTDANGVRIAEYVVNDIPAHGQKVLEHRYALINYTITYQINFGLITNSIPSEYQKYLQAEPGIEVNDPAIQQYAESVAQDDTNPYVIARRLFSDINLFMTYEDDPETTHSALNALRTGKGNCVDYTYLYTACLRSLGIPARVCTGYLYSAGAEHPVGADGLIAADSLKHNWVEFYVNGNGWVVADPTFTYYAAVGDQQEKMVDWNRFAQITQENRLLSLYEGQEESLDYEYQGTAPVITYQSKLALAFLTMPYQDLVGHWASESVMNLRYWSVPIVQGISDNLYGVNRGITRAELVTMLNRVFDYTDPLSEEEIQRTNFSDVADSHWAAAEIQKAVTRGIASGFPDGTFRPNQVVTRAEMAAMLCNVAEITAEPAATPFTDLDQSGYGWAKTSIAKLYQAGLAAGVTSTTFAPEKTLTRGEAAVFIDRWLKSEYYPYDKS